MFLGFSPPVLKATLFLKVQSWNKTCLLPAWPASPFPLVQISLSCPVSSLCSTQKKKNWFKWIDAFNVSVGTSEGCLWSLRGKAGKFQALHPWCGRSKPLKPDLQAIWSETHNPRQYVFWASWVHCHVRSDIWKVKPGEGFASLRPVLGSAMLIGAGVAGYSCHARASISSS